ncbi:GspH/FimT family pseudopilin [Teredinibacter purpureus]|uniref:GspH/FimT family pseudopilin n=1 Tax=Teredinibacter purpureus TaxID=2731756 RepID=UPI0005F85373|nr:GspH/FimT family pseudopilin [Teredinibacter purpureus]
MEKTTGQRRSLIPVNKSLGFSLVELMVVLAIAAMLLVVATPGFMDTSAKSIVRAGVTELASDLAYARSSAITRSTSVSICPSDEESSPRECNDGDWVDGWLIFYDTDEDGNLDAGEEVARVGSSMNARLAITVDNTVTFNRRGGKTNVSEFVFCIDEDTGDFNTRSIVVNVGGLVRGSRDTDEDGIHNSGESGGNLACP